MIKKIKNTIYPVSVYCGANFTKEEYERTFKRSYDEFIEKHCCADAVCSSYQKGIFIGFIDVPSAGTIAHECYHAANYIYRLIGANADLENDEPFAYLLGHLVEECTTIVYSQINKVEEK